MYVSFWHAVRALMFDEESPIMLKIKIGALIKQFDEFKNDQNEFSDWFENISQEHDAMQKAVNDLMNGR